MIKTEFEDRFKEALLASKSDLLCNWLSVYQLYLRMFDSVPHSIPLVKKKSVVDSVFDDSDNESQSAKRVFDWVKTYNKIISALDAENIIYLVYRLEYVPIIVVETKYIIYHNHTNNGFSCLGPDKELPQWIIDSISYKYVVNQYQYLMRSMEGFSSKWLDIKTTEENILKNYNDDFPEERIMTFLREKSTSGLIILHGEPGTGKSTYLRHIINNSAFNVIYCDQSCFHYITDASFIEFFNEEQECCSYF